MKTKVLLFGLLLALTLACNFGSVAPTQVPPQPLTTSDAAPTAIAIPATSTPEAVGVFTLSILVDQTSELVRREQAQTIVDEASDILFGLTSFQLEMIDFQEFSGGGATRSIIQKYLESTPAVQPNGIILFSFGDDGMAKTYGGYAYTLPGPAGYVNPFISPYVHENDLYIGVIHFGHRFARCGYGDSETKISDVSIDGECRNQPGTACVEKFGYSMCSNAVNDLYASTPTYMAASSFVHEIMHSFGPSGNQDHYWTPECTARMKTGISARPYQVDTFNSDEADHYVNMCPFIFDKFVNSYKP